MRIGGDLDALVVVDDGNGMNMDRLHKMLSFGYNDKVDRFGGVNGVKPIGKYGNGFKSGSMRLGKDTMVFTKHTGESCSPPPRVVCVCVFAAIFRA
eukprot:SAG22_NODE_745_length_7499_cov_2.796622_3_plen_96_part_00